MWGFGIVFVLGVVGVGFLERIIFCALGYLLGYFVIVRIMSVGLMGWLVCSSEVTIAVLWILVYACSRVCLMQQWWRLLAAVRWMVWVSLSLSWVCIAMVAVYSVHWWCLYCSHGFSLFMGGLYRVVVGVEGCGIIWTCTSMKNRNYLNR